MQIKLLAYEQARRCVYIFPFLFKDQPVIRSYAMLLSSYYIEWVQSLLLLARRDTASGDTTASART